MMNDADGVLLSAGDVRIMVIRAECSAGREEVSWRRRIIDEEWPVEHQAASNRPGM